MGSVVAQAPHAVDPTLKAALSLLMPNTGPHSQPLFAATWQFGRTAVNVAWRYWTRNRGDISPARLLADSVEQGVIAIEMDRRIHSVGRGGRPNAAGVVELDAAWMEGDRLRAGGVAALHDTLAAISIARLVMEESPHILLVGQGAEQFARKHGFRSEKLLTKESARLWRQWRNQQARLASSVVSRRFPRPSGGSRVRRDAAGRAEAAKGQGEGASSTKSDHDTVGVIGWHAGHLVVACSTSGLRWKLPGRVGDSPIIGSGLYADDQAGAAVATGYGEDIARFNLTSRVVELMRRGHTARQACREAIRFILRRSPDTKTRMIAVIAVRKDGSCASASTQLPFPAYLRSATGLKRI